MTNATTPLTPKTLAEQIGVDAKVVRNYLRKNHTRDATVKNTSWVITPDVAKATRAHFTKQEAKA